ncbi:MAG: hypothetical protein ACPGGD_02190, partial [Thalassolituus sp.]
PCKERFLLTILSFRRIRLYPDGFIQTAKSLCGTQNNPPQSGLLKYPDFCIALGQGFALKAAE